MKILTCGGIYGFEYSPKMLTFNFNKSAILCYFKKVVVKALEGTPELLFDMRRSTRFDALHCTAKTSEYSCLSPNCNDSPLALSSKQD